MKCAFILSILTVQSYAQPVLYPLHIGDSWQYKDCAIQTTDHNIYSYKAVSETLIAGNRYTAILTPSYGIMLYERQAGDSLYVFQAPFTKEYLYFDFSRSPGDTISTTPFGGDTMDVVLREKDTVHYFGGTQRMWRFYVNQSRRTIDDEYWVYVVDSLGIVEVLPDFGDPQCLVGAVIEGRVYGTINGVQPIVQHIPERFLLLQNYPNPLNATTTIRFSVPQSSLVTIEVYNTIGQRVSQANYSRMTSGTHDILLDASALPSGVYYYRLKTVVGMRTGRMVVTR